MQPAIAKKFEDLGLITLHDAIWYFPFRHDDWRAKSSIRDLAIGQKVTVEAVVEKISARRAWRRRGTTITDVTVVDDQGAKLHAVWFNIPYLAKTLRANDRLFLSGTVTSGSRDRLELHNPLFEKSGLGEALHEKMVPVYRSVEGLSQRQIRLVMKQAVSLAGLITDPFHAGTLQHLGLLPLPTALQHIHFPSNPDLGHQAVQRLKFDELLRWHLRFVLARREADTARAPTIPFREMEIRSFVQELPFSLTDDQRVAAWQIFQDMAQSQPMSRLVQGDVGSGKTVVAALACYSAALSQAQVAFIAPTLVLAEQHWRTLAALLIPRGITLGLLTGQRARVNHDEVSREEFIDALSAGSITVAVGTHALLQPLIRFHHLGLVVVDEQQRFGVDQRQTLLERQSASPHFLSLTATPIPRSFALWLTGILSVSSIKTKPPGRSPIATEVIGPRERARVDRAIQSTLERQEQVYVITPLIEESDSLGVRAATTEYDRLRRALPRQRVGLLHGSLPAPERIGVLDAFRQGQLDILVSTTVIEVGVDVPTATLMVIEGAERFGLAQLHQLRGRVGRSHLASRCLLVSDKDEPTIRQRLNRVAQTTDGFAVAELDLQERGAGDLYGQRQSGLPTWQLASLSDIDLFVRVQRFVADLPLDEQRRLSAFTEQTEEISNGFHPE